MLITITKNYEYKKTRYGITLIEIMVALLILAGTFLPLIAVMGSFTKDTDSMNSYVFAQTTARNILDTLLDEVPFNSMQADTNNIAKLIDYDGYKIDSFKSLIGTANEKAEGEITDERGTKYKIKIYCFPIPVTKGNSPDTNSEITFSYKKRPKYEEQDNFFTYKKDQNPCFLRNTCSNPYDMEGQEKNSGAYELGAKKNFSSEEYYVMKKILFQIVWKSRDGKEKNLELFTMKANLDSEKGT